MLIELNNQKIRNNIEINLKTLKNKWNFNKNTTRNKKEQLNSICEKNYYKKKNTEYDNKVSFKNS